MFLTPAKVLHQSASAIFPDHHVWHLVQVPLANPLVISRFARLSLSRREPAFSTYMSETGFFAAMAANPNARVLSADLLLPPQVSASGRWEAHAVLELWECEEPEDPENHCCILRTAQADHSDSVFGTTAADLKKRRRLYRMKPQDTQPRRRRTS